MRSIEIETEKIYNLFKGLPDLVEEINQTAIALDKAGAPKEERYQAVIDFMNKIGSVNKEAYQNYYGMLFYTLVTAFGLLQHLFQSSRTAVATLFPRARDYRNHGIREYNAYSREIADKKIQDQLHKNLNTYLTGGGKDKDSQLYLDLEYLEKYRKINCMKVTKEIQAPELDESINQNDNKKAYELALLKIVGG